MSSSSYLFFDQDTRVSSVPYSTHTQYHGAPNYGEKFGMGWYDERRLSQHPIKPIFSKEQIQDLLVHSKLPEGCLYNPPTPFGPNFPFSSEAGSYGSAFGLNTPAMEQLISPISNNAIYTGIYTAGCQTTSGVNNSLSSLRTSFSAPDAQTMNLGCPRSDTYEYPGSDVDAEGETDSEFEQEGSPGFTNVKNNYSPRGQTASCAGKGSAPSIQTLRSQNAGPSSACVGGGVQRTRPSRRKTARMPPRTKQVSGPFVDLSPAARDSLRCPLCPRIMRHGLDLDRHYRGHFQSTPTAVCSGVRIERAAEYGIDLGTSVVEELDGVFRVGKFCRATFTRRDSLIRHLKNPRCPCVGDVIPAEEYAGIKDL